MIRDMLAMAVLKQVASKVGLATFAQAKLRGYDTAEIDSDKLIETMNVVSVRMAPKVAAETLALITIVCDAVDAKEGLVGVLNHPAVVSFTMFAAQEIAREVINEIGIFALDRSLSADTWKAFGFK